MDKSDVITVIDGATQTTEETFTIPAKTDTATINILLTASSPDATVEVFERNEAAEAADEADPWALVSGASYTESVSGGLTGLTKGKYKISITGTVNNAIYVTVSR